MDYIAKLSTTIQKTFQKKDSGTGQAVKGIMRGDMVEINGTKYPYEAVTDLLPVDGFGVWCQMSQDGKKAIIIGA